MDPRMAAYIAGIEHATGQSIEQIRALGVWPEAGFCRKLDCPGFHLVNAQTSQHPATSHPSQEAAQAS